jgi:hypothetical protein
MAAVTVVRKRKMVYGNRQVLNYTATVVTTGDTLVTGLRRVEFVSSNTPAELTKITASGGTLTFTGTAASALVHVEGY